MFDVFSKTFLRVKTHFSTPPVVGRAQDLLAQRISPEAFPEVRKIICDLDSLDVDPDKKAWVNSLAADLDAKLDNVELTHGSRHGILYNPAMLAKDYLPGVQYRDLSQELFYQLQMNFNDENSMNR